MYPATPHVHYTCVTKLLRLPHMHMHLHVWMHMYTVLFLCKVLNYNLRLIANGIPQLKYKRTTLLHALHSVVQVAHALERKVNHLTRVGNDVKLTGSYSTVFEQRILMWLVLGKVYRYRRWSQSFEYLPASIRNTKEFSACDRTFVKKITLISR